MTFVHIGARGERDVPLGIEENILATYGDHIAYFWQSEEDFAAGVDLLTVGLREGDHCVVFGHHDANQKVLAVLNANDITVDDLVAGGRLAVLGGHETGDAMLAEIGATFTRMLDAGAFGLRLLGNIGWSRTGWPDEMDILAFEANVTRAIADLPCIVVCMYDVRSIPRHLIVRAGFALHPFTLSGSGHEKAFGA